MTIKCIKGNRYIGLKKYREYPVIDVFNMGKDFGYAIRIVIQYDANRRKTLYVPVVHKGRLGAGDEFNVNMGDPTNKARVRFVGEYSIRLENPA